MKCGKYILFLINSLPLLANAAGASNEWSDSYGFRSASDRQVLLLQADLIERMDNDYYKNIGKNTTTISVDNRQGNFVEGAEAGSSLSGLTYTTTNTIGAINNTSNNIDINGNSNSVVTTSSATSNGSLNGSVLIDSTYTGDINSTYSGNITSTNQ